MEPNLIFQLLQFGAAGAVIVVVLIYTRNERITRQIWADTIQKSLDANTNIMNLVLEHLGEFRALHNKNHD